LKYGDLSKRIDSLKYLTRMIVGISEDTKPVLILAANQLIGSFNHLMS